MRIDKRFILRDIAGEYMAVPVGEKAGNCNGLILLNTAGAFLWTCMQEECSEEDLLHHMQEEYEVSEMVLRRDLRQFLDKMRAIGCIESDHA